MRWRFLLFVAIAAAVPPVAALLLTANVATSAEAALDQHLTAASSALHARLEAEAARRHEMLLRLSLLPDVVNPVHAAAEAGQPPPASVVTQVQQAIAAQFSNQTPDLVAVATAQGAVALVTTGDQHGKTFDLKVSDIPAAEEALRGARADGFHSFHGTLYRFSAAPVGIADAAIVVGDRVGDAAMSRWRNEIRADTSIVSDGRVIASSLKGPSRMLIAGAAEQPNRLFGSGQFDLGPLNGVLPLYVHPGSRRSLAESVGGAFAVVSINSDLAWVGMAQLAGFLLGFGLLLIGLVWSQVIYGPVVRQARSIEAHLARLRVERSARLTKKGFSPPFTAIAELLDRVTDHWSREAVHAASTPAGARETPPVPAETSRPSMPRAPVELPLAKLSAPAGHDPIEGTPAFPFDAFGRAARANSSPPAGASEQSSPGGSVAKIQPSDPEPAIAAARSEPRSTPQAPFAAISPGGAARPASLPGSATYSTGSSVLPELLARSQELEHEMLEAAVDPDDAHFLSVYEEFLSVRQRCSESTDGLTFDRFSLRLRKNREQLVEKYACKSVRFQVYVKEGKAAVKALPVR